MVGISNLQEVLQEPLGLLQVLGSQEISSIPLEFWHRLANEICRHLGHMCRLGVVDGCLFLSHSLRAARGMGKDVGEGTGCRNLTCPPSAWGQHQEPLRGSWSVCPSLTCSVQLLVLLCSVNL